MNDRVTEICDHFQFKGFVKEIIPVTIGHINDTYFAVFQESGEETRTYVLQKINRFVFKNPQGVMTNIERVTQHLRHKIIESGGDPDRETLNLIETVDAHLYYVSPGGDYWRAYRFIDRARTYEGILNPQHVYQTAWAIGNFQAQMADFPAEQLCETIPNFHNTPKRLEAFRDAVQKDRVQRAKKVQEEIHFLEERANQVSVLTDLMDHGILPVRVSHNDAKLNNVMIDDQTGRGICILDLDTVMPGLVLYDFGDAVRSTAALVAEDSPDYQTAGIDLDVFERLVQGYLDAAKAFLTPLEIDNLAFSGRLITLEQAIRFLADYLNGDIYYKVDRDEHNLDRARTQMNMVHDMEKNYDKMLAIIAKYR